MHLILFDFPALCNEYKQVALRPLLVRLRVHRYGYQNLEEEILLDNVRLRNPEFFTHTDMP